MFFLVNHTVFIVIGQAFILNMMRRVNPEFGYLSHIAFARSAPTISFSDSCVSGGESKLRALRRANTD